MRHSNRDQSALAANHERAMQDFDRAIGHFEQLLADNPRSLADRYELVACCRRKADETWAPEEAEALYERARGQMQSLADGNPDVHEYQARLAGIQFQMGVFYSDKDEEKALEAFQQAREKLAPLVERYPNIPDYRADLAATLLEIGRDHYRHGRLDDAAGVVTQLLKHFRWLLDRFGGQSQYEEKTAESLDLGAQIAQSHFDHGERKKAIECVERCLQFDPDDKHLGGLLQRFQDGAAEE